MGHGRAPIESPQRPRSFRDRIRAFRPLVQVVAFLSLFLLCILSAFIVPIVPDYLRVNDTEIEIGALLAANSIVAIFANPVAAFVTDRYGYQNPVVGGLLLYAAAAFVSAFAKEIASHDLTKTYVVLFVARGIQGLGDAFAVVASLAMVAIWYTGDDERAKAMGNTFAAAGIGLVVGYPFGGAFSAVPGGIDAGWKWPFIITGLISLAAALIALLMGSSPPGGGGERTSNGSAGPSMFRLLCDPYVAVCCLSLISTYSSLAFMEPLLPVWMKAKFHEPTPTTYSVGLILLALTIAYTIGSLVYGRIPGERSYWLNALVSQIVVAACLALLPLVAIPSSRNLFYAIIPLFFMGLCYGVVDLVVSLVLGVVVEKRYAYTSYGGVYALVSTSFTISFVVSPICGATVAKYVHFNWAAWGLAIFIFATSFFLVFLRDMKGGAEEGASSKAAVEPTEKTKLLSGSAESSA
ncbi:chromaffin granule amine transporter-like [Oscarella lobularis]|uniref:chromaffin granule amine transporter-like n=1 Tax=Oscarella lobularis TaxID=121494 RepID=UPI003313F227